MMNQVHENNAVKPTEQSRGRRAKRRSARHDSVTRKERKEKKRTTSRSGTVGFVYLNARDARAGSAFWSLPRLLLTRNACSDSCKCVYILVAACCRAIKFLPFYIDLRVRASPSGDPSYRDMLYAYESRGRGGYFAVPFRRDSRRGIGDSPSRLPSMRRGSFAS